MSTQIIGMETKKGAFDEWVKEISAQRLAALSQPGTFTRNVFSETSILKKLSVELSYSPPSPHRFPMYLKQQEESVRAKSTEVFPDGERIRSRHDQLAALDNKLAAFLEAANHVTSLEEVADAIQKREAVRFLLSKLPEEALHKKSFDPSLSDNVRESSITRLREWLDRLRVELGRIKEQFERLEAGGVSLRKNGELYTALEHVVWAMGDAEENLTLVHTSNYGGVAGFRQRA